MVKKEPLYPHVPKGKIAPIDSESTETELAKLARQQRIILSYCKEVIAFLERPQYEWTALKIKRLKSQMERCISLQLD